MNRLGTGRALVCRKRPYTIKADCTLLLELWARDEDAAEDDFNEYCEAVQYRHPELVLSLTSIRED